MERNGRLPPVNLGNGDTFEGEWFNGKMQGHGIFTWANGDRCVLCIWLPCKYGRLMESTGLCAGDEGGTMWQRGLHTDARFGLSVRKLSLTTNLHLCVVWMSCVVLRLCGCVSKRQSPWTRRLQECERLDVHRHARAGPANGGCYCGRRWSPLQSHIRQELQRNSKQSNTTEQGVYNPAHCAHAFFGKISHACV